jgi:hypothetical protein
MIHVTLQNGETMLFNEKEVVCVTNWIEGDYIGPLRDCQARDLLKRLPFSDDKNYVLEVDGYRQYPNYPEDYKILSVSPIKEVKQYSYSFFGR